MIFNLFQSGPTKTIYIISQSHTHTHTLLKQKFYKKKFHKFLLSIFIFSGLFYFVKINCWLVNYCDSLNWVSHSLLAIWISLFKNIYLKIEHKMNNFIIRICIVSLQDSCVIQCGWMCVYYVCVSSVPQIVQESSHFPTSLTISDIARLIWSVWNGIFFYL